MLLRQFALLMSTPKRLKRSNLKTVIFPNWYKDKISHRTEALPDAFFVETLSNTHCLASQIFIKCTRTLSFGPKGRLSPLF